MNFSSMILPSKRYIFVSCSQYHANPSICHLVTAPLHDVIMLVYFGSTYSSAPNKSEDLNFTATGFHLIWINAKCLQASTNNTNWQYNIKTTNNIHSYYLIRFLKYAIKDCCKKIIFSIHNSQHFFHSLCVIKTGDVMWWSYNKVTDQWVWHKNDSKV